MKYATKKAAKEALEQYKDLTGYFSGDLNMADMKEALHYMYLGEAETNVILAALVLAGAKFTVEQGGT